MKGFSAQLQDVGDTRWHVHESCATPRHRVPAVVFVPGLGEGDYMAPHGRVLAAHWRVLVPDMPGFGRTRGPRRLRSVDEFAAALTCFLRATVDEPAFVVASSFGAQIAVAAAEAGAPIARMVLVSPTFDAAARSVLGQLRRWLPTMFVEPPTLAVGLAKSYLHCGVRTPIIAFRTGLHDRPEDRLRGIDIPILIVRGERDHIVSAAWAAQLAAAGRRARVEAIRGFAHTLDYSAPDELGAVTIPFLEGAG